MQMATAVFSPAFCAIALMSASVATAETLDDGAADLAEADFLSDSENIDYFQEDMPIVQFGRAVDLAGTDIEPLTLSDELSIGASPRLRPLRGGRLTSRFGYRTHPVLGGRRFHAGIDLAASHGTPVTATSSGRVTSAARRGAAGNMVVIDHGGGIETRYAHLSRFAVRPGDRVTENQVIGFVGSTGRSTGPHLHYETRSYGRPVDPVRNWAD